MAKEIILKTEHIAKTFFSNKGDTDTIEDVSIDVEKNEFLVLLGPGQCGKTVFLQIICGLMKPTMGKVYIDNQPVEDVSSKVGFVFQKTGLYPWKTTMQNVEIGMKYRGIPKKERREIAQKYIDLVGLHGFEYHFPGQLSGGMKQRVGIARAYAANAEILIMDEPFGALDAQTRYSMQDEILNIWEKEKRTIIFVTNNIEEAVYLGDRIIQFTDRPAKVRQEYVLDMLARPRDYMDETFLAKRSEISNNEEAVMA